MQEKDSNPRPPGYVPGELAAALSCYNGSLDGLYQMNRFGNETNNRLLNPYFQIVRTGIEPVTHVLPAIIRFAFRSPSQLQPGTSAMFLAVFFAILVSTRMPAFYLSMKFSRSLCALRLFIGEVNMHRLPLRRVRLSIKI